MQLNLMLVYTIFHNSFLWNTGCVMVSLLAAKSNYVQTCTDFIVISRSGIQDVMQLFNSNDIPGDIVYVYV